MASFYKDVVNKNYVNLFYSLCIALDEYFANRLLNGDQKRIVYSSTEYALIKRSGQNTWNNANLPFINYKMDEKTFGGKRNWFSMEGYSQGIYSDELRKKIRICPVSISFDATYWTNRDDDYQYATDMMLMDAAAETKLAFYLDYKGTLIKNIAIVDFSFDTSPKFTETDWLEKNNIWAFSLNPSIQTWLTLDTAECFCIPKTILFNYAVKHDLIQDGTPIEKTEYEELFTFTIDHINGTIKQN